MDRQTLSNYGWIIITSIILAIMISVVTPLGNYVGNAVSNTLDSYIETNKKAMKDDNINRLENEWDESLDGEISGDLTISETVPTFEPLTRPAETLPVTEPTTSEQSVTVPSINSANNILTIYYSLNTTENLKSGFYNKSGLIYTFSSGVETVCKQTVKYGQKLSGGLLDATYFGLTHKDGLLFVGWKVKNTGNKTIYSETTEYKPEELTTAIELGNREIYLEAVWTALPVTVRFDVNSATINNPNYDKNSVGMLTYTFAGISGKVDYEMKLNNNTGYSLPNGNTQSVTTFPDGKNAIKLTNSSGLQFDYWTLNGKRVYDGITRAELLIMNNGGSDIVLRPHFS